MIMIIWLFCNILGLNFFFFFNSILIAEIVLIWTDDQKKQWPKKACHSWVTSPWRVGGAGKRGVVPLAVAVRGAEPRAHWQTDREKKIREFSISALFLKSVFSSSSCRCVSFVSVCVCVCTPCLLYRDTDGSAHAGAGWSPRVPSLCSGLHGCCCCWAWAPRAAITVSSSSLYFLYVAETHGRRVSRGLNTHTHTTRVHASCIRVSMCPSFRLALVHGDARCFQCSGVPSYPPCTCTNLCGKEACCKLLLLPRFKQTNKPHQHHQILISLTDSFLHAPHIRLSQITTHPLHRALYSHV